MESVCQVVHEVVADVVTACDNPLVLNVGLAVGAEGERPGSGESCKLTHHERGVAVVVVFKFGVFAVYTISHGLSSWAVGFQGTAWRCSSRSRSIGTLTLHLGVLTGRHV